MKPLIGWVLLLTLCGTAGAAVPNRITYQGRLTKTGISAAGLHTFRACLKNGGATLWCDNPGQQLNLPPSGDFTLLIQPNTPIDWFNSTVTLELTVDGQLLSPTDEFTSVPYALTASTAAAAQSLLGTVQASQVRLTGGAALDSWQSSINPAKIDAAAIQGSLSGQWATGPGGVMYYTGGNVGIGTTNPGGFKLEVTGGPIKATGGLVIETRTSDPPAPITGQMWLREDLP